MVDEFFYAFTLQGENAEHKWEDSDKKPEESLPQSNKLVLKRAILGADAAKDEYNVVEVEALANTNMVKIPIVVLKVGEDRQVNLGDVELGDMPVTFRLTKGKGPVHIIGQHLQQAEEDVDAEELSDEEDVEEEEHVIREENFERPRKTLKLSKNHDKKAKNDKGK